MWPVGQVARCRYSFSRKQRTTLQKLLCPVPCYFNLYTSPVDCRNELLSYFYRAKRCRTSFQEELPLLMRSGLWYNTGSQVIHLRRAKYCHSSITLWQTCEEVLPTEFPLNIFFDKEKLLSLSHVYCSHNRSFQSTIVHFMKVLNNHEITQDTYHICSNWF